MAMAALTPVSISYSSALAPDSGFDSLARASCTRDTTQPSQAARPLASPVPRETDGLMGGGRTRNTHWIPARFGSQTPERIISGVESHGSSYSLGEEFGVERAWEKRKRPRK